MSPSKWFVSYAYYLSRSGTWSYHCEVTELHPFDWLRNMRKTEQYRVTTLLYFKELNQQDIDNLKDETDDLQ